MIVSALVLSLDPSTADGVTRLLSEMPEVSIGQPHGVRLPVVVATEDVEQGLAFARTLLDTEGVQSVDVVAIDFDSAEET